MMSAAAKRELPLKEQQLFKTVIKHYESKEYKKGFKVSEQILKKIPEHGETLAMKGLFCSHLDRKEEAHELIKKGIRLDISSPICWHVYGLFHRGEKNYEEAIKCYSQSLRIEKIQDLSVLQVHLGNYEAFNEACQKLLESKPQLKVNWLGYAISFYLLGQPDLADKVLAEFDETTKGQVQTTGSLSFYEDSEFVLFRAFLMEESNDFQRALDFLDSVKDRVCDRRTFMEIRAQLLLKLERFNDAEEEYSKLIEMNPDYTKYLDGLEESKGLKGELDSEKTDKLIALYASLKMKYPRSHLIHRVPLNYAAGEQFSKLVDHFLVEMFRKGVPSLFNSIKDLLVDKEKAIILKNTVESYYANLVAFNTFYGEGHAVESPSVYLWVAYFLAQLADYYRDIDKSLEWINLAIEHSPTAVELYMTKARIYKHAGSFNMAMECMDFARSLDLQDRFINSKCTKYKLQNDKIADAEATISLFTRDFTSTDPTQDLIDMQCIWYAYATGKSHQRQRRYGLALKRYHQIEKHFAEFIDDLIDFHSYSIRKQTFQSYVDLLKNFQSIRHHKYYVRAAKSAIETYLILYESGSSAESMVDGVSLAGIGETERKKLLKKAKKSEAKKTNGDTAKKEDVYGSKYVVGVDYLAEATKFLKPMLKFNENDLEVQKLGCRVYFAKGKYALGFKCLAKAFQLDNSAPFIHLYSVQLAMALENATLQPDIAQGLKEAYAEVFGKEIDLNTLVAENDGYLDESKPELVLIGAQVFKLITPEAALPEFINASNNNLIDSCTLEDALSILNLVALTFNDEERGLHLKEAFAKKLTASSKPLQIWDKKVRNGHIKRITDNDIQSSVLEIIGTNVSTNYITCPAQQNRTLGIKLPFLVMIIKNLKKYFTFEVQVLDDKNVRRRFRASNYQSTTRVKPFICTMPMRLDDGWNQIQFNLSDFTRRAYGTNYIETLRVQIHANCRIRRIYFSDRLYSEEELPPEFKLFLPIQKQA
ncbi:N-alpha-acetyltransferase 16, NatA auxiliary subunit [Terramyces sp. JEL0728]|nr:N-alpha-acetyltransferase 16, NatA auxiliary subunit [Terramyces sp. JEL0728]